MPSKLMHRTFCFFCFTIICFAAAAQIGIEYGLGRKGESPVILINDGLSGQHPMGYDKIKGSPFWKDNWQTARLKGATAGALWIVQAKLNLATGELYYKDNRGDIKVADEGLVRTVEFLDPEDTSTTEAVFVYYMEPVSANQKSIHTYMQVLNAGSNRLLKLTVKEVASADSLFGTQKRYYFSDKNFFYIDAGGNIEKLKKLDKKTILDYFPAKAGQLGKWIEDNNLNMKREQDVVQFLQYVNSSQVKS